MWLPPIGLLTWPVALLLLGCAAAPATPAVAGPPPPVQTTAPSQAAPTAPTPKVRKRSPDELPSLWHANVPFIETTIDGRGPFHLLLDSGTTFLVLDERVVTALSLPRQPLQPDGANVQVEAGVGDAQLREKAWVHELEAGPFHVRDVGALLMDLESLEEAAGMRVDGLLPVTGFQQGLLTLDFPEQTVRLAPGELPSANGRDVLDLLDGDYRPVVSAQVAGRECYVLIDTGFHGYLSLPATVEDALPFVAPPVAMGLSQTAGGVYERREGRLKGTVLLGAHRFRDPIVALSPRQHAVVGSWLLQTFRVTFDMAQRRVRLERDAKDDVLSPPVRGTGVTFRLDGDAWLVAYVVKGSPADTGGLRVGDRIDRINDQPVGSLDFWSFDDDAGDSGIDVRVLGSPEPRVVHLQAVTLIK